MSIAAAKDAPRDGVPANGDAAMAGVFARRDELASEHDRLAKISGGSDAVEATVADIDASLRALEAAERGSFEAWANDGAQGDPPPLRAAERAQLEQGRSLAVADLRAARMASEGVQKRLGELRRELDRVGIEILRHRAAGAISEVRAGAERIRALAGDLKREWSSCVALRELATQRQAEAVGADRREVADTFSGLIAALDALDLPILEWTRPDVDAAAAQWRDALA